MTVQDVGVPLAIKGMASDIDRAQKAVSGPVNLVKLKNFDITDIGIDM